MDGMPLTYEEIKTFYNSEFLKSMLDNLVALNYLKIEKPKKLVNRRRVYDETGKNGYNICKGKLSFPITMILNPEDISPTLTATDSSKLAVIVNNTYIRYLTDNELKLLCGFPLDYIIPADVDKYDLFGNMVVPNVVEEILKKIYL
jgi:DNA (cytosine-5)-methyltransferase 1